VDLRLFGRLIGVLVEHGGIKDDGQKRQLIVQIELLHGGYKLKVMRMQASCYRIHVDQKLPCPAPFQSSVIAYTGIPISRPR
jgi:hypothetical protein